jgi:hypothetical protein
MVFRLGKLDISKVFAIIELKYSRTMRYLGG